MPRSFGYRECNLHNWIQPLHAPLIKVCLRIKSEPVGAGLKNSLSRKQLLHAPIAIGRLCGQLAPGSLCLVFEHNPYAHSRTSQRCIEDVCRDSAHSSSHFLSRSWVICRCCSDASRNSLASSFSSRRKRIASISSADLPLAQTI